MKKLIPFYIIFSLIILLSDYNFSFSQNKDDMAKSLAEDLIDMAGHGKNALNVPEIYNHYKKEAVDKANKERADLPKDYQQLVIDAIKRNLKDPDSAKFVFDNEPIPAVAFDGSWEGEVNVNAKNSYGGYTGYQEWWYWIKGDKVVKFKLSPMSRLK